MEAKSAIKVLTALAQESRLAIFRVLVQAGTDGLSAGRIAEVTGIAPSSLSFHLKELTHANLTDSRQEGRFIFYSARYTTMDELIGYLTKNCCSGTPCPESTISL
jgi:ArsR family transcriptional regulator, arsenate/arsenite/antimonite-responsive transcriptional repressor